MDVALERSRAIVEMMDRIRKTVPAEPDIASLEKAKTLLHGLAIRRDLFPESEFPWPSEEENEHTYCLYKDEDGRALYLGLLRNGATNVPHDHGDSWAIVTCVRGAEKHHLYARTDGNTGPGAATLVHKNEITIGPGESVSMLVGGIHSIEGVRAEPAMMLHCYGKAFEQQSGRLEYDPERKICINSFAGAGGIEDYPLHGDVAK